jgi:hypothetical protein
MRYLVPGFAVWIEQEALRRCAGLTSFGFDLSRAALVGTRHAKKKLQARGDARRWVKV